MRLQMHYSGVGSAAFMSRLSRYLQKQYKVDIVKDHPDVYLSSVWRGKPPKGCKTAHRADGVYFDANLKSGSRMNKDIQTAINKANGVIYQSQYSRKICQGILKVKQTRDVIIHNGFDFSECEGVSPETLGFDRTLVAIAKWRPLKRPKSIAKGFLEASLPGVGLIMVGDINKSDTIKHKRIKYVGRANHAKVFQFYKGCSGVIHISRLDACPNAVVEGLAFRKPILCNNVGGTPEIVQDSGVVINIDPPFKYRKFPLGNPDCVKPRVIAKGLSELLSKKWSIYRPDLSMESAAKSYYCFLENLLSC